MASMEFRRRFKNSCLSCASSTATNGDGWSKSQCAVVSALFELSSQEGKGFSDGFADINSAGLMRCSGSEAAKTSDEVIDSCNLSDDDLREIFPKLFVVVSLGKEFREGAYGDEGILDFMSNA